MVGWVSQGSPRACRGQCFWKAVGWGTQVPLVLLTSLSCLLQACLEGVNYQPPSCQVSMPMCSEVPAFRNNVRALPLALERMHRVCVLKLANGCSQNPGFGSSVFVWHRLTAWALLLRAQCCSWGEVTLVWRVRHPCCQALPNISGASPLCYFQLKRERTLPPFLVSGRSISTRTAFSFKSIH